MSVSRGTSGRTGTASSAGGAKGQPRRPNRSQARAIDARARTATPVEPVGSAVEEVIQTTATRPQTRTRSGLRTRTTSRPVGLAREEEYRYIRSDLRRLLLTAGLLLLLMMVLLVLIEL